MRIEIIIVDRKTSEIIRYKTHPGCPTMTLNGVLVDGEGRNVSDKYEITDFRICTDE